MECRPPPLRSADCLGVTNQEQKCANRIPRLACKRNRLAIAQKEMLGGVEDEGAEGIEVLCLLVHKGGKKFSIIFPEFWKDFHAATCQGCRCQEEFGPCENL